MIIGEGPGANEDKEGKPFVGRAGKLLDKMLQAIKLSRNNVYISNVVNFRPPLNRRPTDAEIKRYLPFLTNHIEIISPKILLLLGSTALNALIGNEIVISKARGKWIKKKIGKINNQNNSIFPSCFFNETTRAKKICLGRFKNDKKKISELKIKIKWPVKFLQVWTKSEEVAWPVQLFLVLVILKKNINKKLFRRIKNYFF